MRGDDWGVFATVIVVAGLIAFVVMAAIHGEQQWETFREKHRCRVVGKVAASNGYGFSTSGKFVTTYEPEKTTWLCDDGMTYTR